jgi:hypothetical protein
MDLQGRVRGWLRPGMKIALRRSSRRVIGYW